MRYGVTFSIITKGDPTFLLDIPGFAEYGPKFVAVSIEGPAEVLRLLSPAAPDFEARVEAVHRLSSLGISTSIRLDPVIVHIWKAIYGPDWLKQLDILAQRFANAGVKHVVSSTGRLDKRRPRWPDGVQRESMWERLLKIIEGRSPEAAQDFEREYCDKAETSRGILLRKDLRLAFHRHAKDIFEAYAMTYATCQELTAEESDSTGIPHCEGLLTPFSLKGTDGKFHQVHDCSANCHVSCRGLAIPPCGQPALAKAAPYKVSELRRHTRRSKGSAGLVPVLF
jgi:DNA repair photolyase